MLPSCCNQGCNKSFRTTQSVLGNAPFPSTKMQPNATAHMTNATEWDESNMAPESSAATSSAN